MLTNVHDEVTLSGKYDYNRVTGLVSGTILGGRCIWIRRVGIEYCVVTLLTTKAWV